MINLAGLKKTLSRIASIFQPAYDKIKAWDLPPELDELFENLWNVLSPDIQKGLWKLVNEIYAYKGIDEAKELLKIALKYLAKIFNIKIPDNL